VSDWVGGFVVCSGKVIDWGGSREVMVKGRFIGCSGVVALGWLWWRFEVFGLRERL